MKNQVKVKRTTVHMDSQKGHHVCEGVLRLLKSKTSADIERSNVYLGSYGHTALAISYEEEIKSGDKILHDGSILTVGKNKGLYLSTDEFPHIDIRADYCAKVLVFPENFSRKQFSQLFSLF